MTFISIMRKKNVPILDLKTALSNRKDNTFKT